jgi:hypothetical protein
VIHQCDAVISALNNLSSDKFVISTRRRLVVLIVSLLKLSISSFKFLINVILSSKSLICFLAKSSPTLLTTEVTCGNTASNLANFSALSFSSVSRLILRSSAETQELALTPSLN